MVLVTALVMLSVPVVALWWWRRPPLRPAVPAAVYLAAALVCSWGWPNAPINDTFFHAGYGLLMPWSLLYFLAAAFLKADVGWGHAVAAALVNAALIYGASSLFARRRK